MSAVTLVTSGRGRVMVRQSPILDRPPPARSSRTPAQPLRFPGAWAARKTALERPTPPCARARMPRRRPAPRAWRPSLALSAWAAALAAGWLFVVVGSLVSPSEAAGASRSPDEVTQSVPAPGPARPRVVPTVVSIAAADKGTSADARVLAAAARAPARRASPPPSGLAGIFDGPVPSEPTEALPTVVAVSAEEQAKNWARQVKTVVGDDLTSTETGCIGTAARAGLRDDPSLWGPAIAGDLAALRPFGDKVARGCGVAPERLAPVIARALDHWGASAPGSHLIGVLGS
jgi:hypothetical protein